MTIKIYKDGSLIRITPVDANLAPLLQRTLTYTRINYQAPNWKNKSKKRIQKSAIECFTFQDTDGSGDRQMITSAGYLQRIYKVLRKSNREVKVFQSRRARRENAFTPNWKAMEAFELRHKQREVLEQILKCDRGQVRWATGAGKSFTIVLICCLLPKANIVVTTKHSAVLEDLYKNLSAHLPAVGINYSKKKVRGKRVMCCSAGTLHHMDPSKVDLLLADEVHELATDKMFEQFAQFRFTKMIGLSANYQDRFDGADFELEGIFGQLITDMSYDEGVEQGTIVPIEVHWQDMRMDRNPAENKYSDIAKNRSGIWRNEWRNAKIAENAREYPEEQILITVKTFDHACHLKKFLPEFTLVYAPGDDKEHLIDRFVKWKLLTGDEPIMTNSRLTELKESFETGELKKVIATSVWNRGVNFKELSVLIRADGGSSAIDDTQIPGRLSRTSEDGKKTHGILIDYLDQFDPVFESRSKKRRSTYKKKGWTQVMPAARGK